MDYKSHTCVSNMFNDQHLTLNRNRAYVREIKNQPARRDSLMAKGDCTRVRDDAQNISALQLKEQNMNSSYTRKNY